MGYFDLVIFFGVDRRRRRRFVLLNNESRRMASTMTQDLEELDYMRESGREGMGEGRFVAKKISIKENCQ